ncbi:MAG: ABC transporter substrate-binding protein [Xanthobacteraceae bacterium]
MKRREFIAFVGGAAIGAPLAARAQQAATMRRIGILMNFPAGDTEAERRIAAFLKAMNELGWVDGKNLRVDYRWGGDTEIVKSNAAELVAVMPDVIVANAPPSVQALQQIDHTIPVVFAAVTDPVALGIVANLARPGGNVTGFSPSELDFSGKWLELLKEVAPLVKRVAVLRAASNSNGQEQITAIRAAAPSLGVDLSYVDVSDPDALDREVDAFAHSSDGGLIVLRTTENLALRDRIIFLSAHYRLPAVYPLRFCATGGGLMSYGPDIVEEFREAAGYVDRVLRGAKPADLPVQSASKFELVINLKTARQLSLTIPSTLLATADEVIE